jgi:hypothetical protein
VVGIAPLFQHFKSPVFELLGVREFTEPSDLLVEPAYRDAMAQQLAEWGYLLWLNRVPRQSDALLALENAFKKRGVLIKRAEKSCPTLSLDPSWLDPEQKLNAGRRSDFRRAKRIAGEMGTLQFTLHRPDPEQLPALMDTVTQVEVAGWKGKQRSAMALDPLRGPFYREVAAQAAARGNLRLALLSIGGRPAAMQYALEFRNRLWLLKVGYDERFARSSPGHLLLREVIADAARRSLEAIEFLGTNEPWIKLWTREEQDFVSIRAYPFGLRGMRTFAGDVMKSAWHRLERVS